MHYNIISISKIVHNKSNISAPLKFKLCRRGDLYTTDLLGIYFMFFMVCHGLLVAMFFMFQAYLSFVRRL